MTPETALPSSGPLRVTPAWYRFIYVACIVVLSVETMRSARALTDHRFWLAAIEIITALLLLVRRAQRFALVGLLAVYAVVAIHAVVTGKDPTPLILFAASAVVVADTGYKKTGVRKDGV
jgi:hypothetical protein